MNIFINDYSAADVSDATGVPPATLQNWLKRGVIVGHREGQIIGGGSPGRYRRFSFNAVMEIAVAAAFVKMGVALETAFLAGAKIAHIGEAYSFWVGEGEAPPASLRKPGLPWPRSQGDTLVTIQDGKPGIVRSVAGANPLWDMFGGGHPEGFCVVNASKIFDRVATRLGHHPSEILASAYPEDAA